MSDNNHLSPDERLMKAVRSMKEDVDLFFTQLKNGTYASPDTFANNWEHLIRIINEMKPMLSKPGVTETLLRTDRKLMADLQAITHAVEIIENFLVCAEHQISDNGCKPR